MSNPDWQIKAIGEAEINNCGKAMVAVNDFQAIGGFRADNRTREFAGFSNDVCKCRKPILRVMDVCSRCLLSVYTPSDDCDDASLSLQVEQLWAGNNARQQPVSFSPKG